MDIKKGKIDISTHIEKTFRFKVGEGYLEVRTHNGVIRSFCYICTGVPVFESTPENLLYILLKYWSEVQIFLKTLKLETSKTFKED